MANASSWNSFTAVVCVFLFLGSAPICLITASTDTLDVIALHSLLKSLQYPSELQGWKSRSGDPCKESWKGVTCSGSSVISIKLKGLHLRGSLGRGLIDLLSLKQLDVSANHIHGEIRYLPPHAIDIDLSSNNFNTTHPHALDLMKDLLHINLSHNAISGPLDTTFKYLQNLRKIDLSYNNFTGDLPASMELLTNLSELYLQNNKFTGPVNCLGNLNLTDLNLENNQFNGSVPVQLYHVKHLSIAGNNFEENAALAPGSNTRFIHHHENHKTEVVLGLLIPICVLLLVLVGFHIRRRSCGAGVHRFYEIRSQPT